MKACKNCSASLDDGERYCPNCGDAAPAWSDATVVAAWCCGLVGFAIGVVGAFQSYLGIYALLENVGAPPVPQEFSQSKGESVAFLLELLLAIAVLVWLYRPADAGTLASRVARRSSRGMHRVLGIDFGMQRLLNLEPIDVAMTSSEGKICI